MRKVSTLIATAAVIGAAFSVFRWGPSLATSFSGGGATVEAHILSAPRLDVSATTETGVTLGVSGVDGSRLEVDVPNPITLSSSTQALLAGQRNCTYSPLGRLDVTPDGGVFNIAAGPSGASFKAHAFGNNVDYVSCWIHSGAGPYPNCVIGDGGVGFDLHSSEVMDVDLATNLSWKLDCLTCIHIGAPAQDNAIVTGSLSLCTPPP